MQFISQRFTSFLIRPLIFKNLVPNFVNIAYPAVKTAEIEASAVDRKSVV